MVMYQDGSKELRLPFTLFADIECILEPFPGCARDPNLAQPYTDNYLFMYRQVSRYTSHFSMVI